MVFNILKIKFYKDIQEIHKTFKMDFTVGFSVLFFFRINIMEMSNIINHSDSGLSVQLERH